tara:strand:+ start:149 stop:685 length:537 start_codon:yes stop_codon:yes gene_type:complete
MEASMPLDVVDKGKVTTESEEMRMLREANIEKAPQAEFFKLRAQLLKKGRSNQLVADTGNMWANLKVYASGGENGLHNHTDQDHFHLVLKGKACFYGPRGEEKICDAYEGVMLPSGSYYRFEAVGDEPLILLRVGAKTEPTAEHARYNIYGKPLKSNAKENGRVGVIAFPDEFWGAEE